MPFIFNIINIAKIANIAKYIFSGNGSLKVSPTTTKFQSNTNTIPG